jgi:hexokinase
MYLGEITRLVLLSLIDASTYSPTGKKEALLFGGKGNEVVNKMWGIDTQYMSEIEDAWGEGDEDLPRFASFDVNDLEEEKKSRLEKVRKVIVNRFGYRDAEVGAWDAAVCFLIKPSSCG